MTARLRSLLTDRALRLGAGLALAAVALGAGLAFGGPLITLAGLAALGVGLWALTSLEVGLLGVIAVIMLLPFGALPVKIVFTPTFLDLALLAVLGVYLLQWMGGRRRRLALTPVHPLLLVFLVLAVFSFALGRSNGPLTSNLVRRFGELLLSIAFVFLLVDVLQTRAQLSGLVRWVLVFGALAALLGLGLYFLPPDLSERLLSALRVFDYPSGGVLRYIEDNPENAQRAIGTSIDPNALGGMLAMVGGLLAPQLLAPRGLLGPRWVAYLAFGLVAACLVLTYSRGAMAALAAALLGIVLLRERRLLWPMLAGGLLILLLPATQAYVARFGAGLRGEDLATQMRFGEYKDAFILIGRYPVFGVGFAGAPDIDIYLGVSNAYLLIAQKMGLVGLAAFLAAMAALFGWAWRRRHAALADAELAPLWLGAHASLGAALVVGLVDHYFFNLDFQHAGALFWISVGLCLAATRMVEGDG